MAGEENQTVLVTGANRGMGHYVTQLLDRGAARVYAAARDPRQDRRRRSPASSRSRLDVTDTRSVGGGGGGSDGCQHAVDNAGIFRAASVLDPGGAQLREQLETNLFGPLNLASASPTGSRNAAAPS